MSLHLRLALSYGALTALVVLALASAAFMVHGRSLYDDVDRTLSEDASHLAPVLDIAGREAIGLDPPTTGRVTTFVRLYDANGEALSAASADASAPPIDPIPALGLSHTLAYPRLLRVLPGGGIDSAGSFTTIERDGEPRARVYVLPVSRDGVTLGYVEAWSSLGGVDGAIERFELMMLGLSVVSVLLVTFGSFAIGGLALRPVAAMIATADAIARSRDFRRRVPEPAASGGDELAQLARTLNEMLDTVEVSHVAQRRFVADAAHELRAPLTAIRGNLELLSRVPDMSPSDRDETVAAIHARSERLARLVDELLLLARSDAGQRSRRAPVELDEVVLAALAELRGVPDAARVTIESIEPSAIIGDRDRLHQVIAILVDNARRYSGPDTAVVVTLTHEGGEAVLRVRDSGIGIAPDDLPHVFERFFRSPRARALDADGSGLGLAIARLIVEQHGGRIGLESEVDVGTTAVVRLPLQSRAVSAATDDSGGVQRALSGGSALADTVRSEG